MCLCVCVFVLVCAYVCVSPVQDPLVEFALLQTSRMFVSLLAFPLLQQRLSGQQQDSVKVQNTGVENTLAAQCD